MIMYIQSSGTVSLFKHFRGYLGTFRDVDAYSAKPTGSQLGGEKRPPLPVFKMENNALILKRKALKFSFKFYVLHQTNSVFWQIQ